MNMVFAERAITVNHSRNITESHPQNTGKHRPDLMRKKHYTANLQTIRYANPPPDRPFHPKLVESWHV